MVIVVLTDDAQKKAATEDVVDASAADQDASGAGKSFTTSVRGNAGERILKALAKVEEKKTKRAARLAQVFLIYYWAWAGHLLPRLCSSEMTRADTCPLTRREGGLVYLHSADEDAVKWLTSFDGTLCI